jgi:hypothetical protein
MSHQPRHISEALDNILNDVVHPLIREAADREEAGETIDWPAVYAEADAQERRAANPRQQLSLGLTT